MSARPSISNRPTIRRGLRRRSFWLSTVAIREAEPVAASPYGGDHCEESLVVREDVWLLVVGAQSDEESIRQRLLHLRNRADGTRVRIVTPRILCYWLRVWHPRQYRDWTVDARLVSGPDVLSRIDPPTRDSYVRSLLNITSLVLSFPSLDSVIMQRRPAWFAEETFHWYVLRGWYLKLHLETGNYSPQHEQNIAWIRRHYPEAVRELAEIRAAALAKDCRLEDLRFRGFRLLKETAVAVNRALTQESDGNIAARLAAASA